MAVPRFLLFSCQRIPEDNLIAYAALNGPVSIHNKIGGNQGVSVFLDAEDAKALGMFLIAHAVAEEAYSG
jgi:hypothetical protein